MSGPTTRKPRKDASQASAWRGPQPVGAGQALRVLAAPGPTRNDAHHDLSDGRRGRRPWAGPLPGPLTVLVHALADVPVPGEDSDERLARARQLLQDAISRTPTGPPGSPAKGFGGVRVDKYFGTKLPPVCARLGCYVTDDGKRYYCINPACQKHKIRET